MILALWLTFALPSPGNGRITLTRFWSQMPCLLLYALHWHHYDHDGVSNHQPHCCLLNRLFRRRSKKTSKLRVTGLCEGNSPGPVNSPHKGPVTRKMFPFDDVIMEEPSAATSTSDAKCAVYLLQVKRNKCSFANTQGWQRKRHSSKKTSKPRVTGLVWGIHQWIPRTEGQQRENCFHLMTSSLSWLLTCPTRGFYSPHHEEIPAAIFPHEGCTILIRWAAYAEKYHNDGIMSTIASQITSPTIVYSTIYSGADQRKHRSSASLAFVQGIHRGPVNSPHKWPVTRKMFPFDDVITNITTLMTIFLKYYGYYHMIF